MQAILDTRKTGKTLGKSGYLKGVTYATVAALSAAAGVAGATGTELTPAILPGFYEIRANGDAVFLMENGQALSLNQNQYVILENGLLHVIDAVAAPIFETLQIQGTMRQELVNSSSHTTDTNGAAENTNVEQTAQANPTSTDERDPSAEGDITGTDISSIGGAAGFTLGLLVVTTSEPPEVVPEPDPPVFQGRIIDPVIPVLGDTGAGSGTLAANALNQHVVWENADGGVDRVEVSSNDFTPTLAPGFPSGILGGTWDAVLNSGTTAYTAQQTVLFATATDMSGDVAIAGLQVAGQLVLADASVADTASVTIQGADADDYVGYWAASTAATSPLTNFGREVGRTSTVDLANGDNYLRLGHEAVNGGTFTYTGGTGNDTIRVADYFSNWNGVSTLDMRAGGDNQLDAGDWPAVSGDLTYYGGSGSDTLTMGRWFGSNQSTVILDMTEGGTNQLTAMWMAGASGTLLSYSGGSGDDTLTFGMQFGASGGDVQIDMSEGGNNSLQAVDLAAASASLSYTGGTGDDTITFGNNLAVNGGSASFDMSLGGTNQLTALSFAGQSGQLSYVGGAGADTLSFGDYLAVNSGSASFDMSAGGENQLTAGEFVAESGQLSYTGSNQDETLGFGGYLAVNGGSANFDLSSGGDKVFTAGGNAAQSGSLSLTGGNDDDSVTVGSYAVTNGGNMTIDLKGGSNMFAASGWFAHSGTFTYDGGVRNDSISFGDYSGAQGGDITLRMGDGANSLTAGSYVAHSGNLKYYGGAGPDELNFGTSLAQWYGDAYINAGNGLNTLDAGDDVARTGKLVYDGGVGADELTFGTGLAHNGGTATLNVGSDSSADKIVFNGSVADTVGTCIIQNFDPLIDTIDVPHTSYTVVPTGGSDCQVSSTAGTHFSFTVSAVTATDLSNAII